MEFNGYRHLFGDRHSSKYLLLCSTEEILKNGKEIVGNNKGLGKHRQHFHFWDVPSISMARNVDTGY